MNKRNKINILKKKLGYNKFLVYIIAGGQQNDVKKNCKRIG